MTNNFESMPKDGRVSALEKSAVAAITGNVEDRSEVRKEIERAESFRERRKLIERREQQLKNEMKLLDLDVANNNIILFEMRKKGEEGTARYLEIVKANKENEQRLQHLREEINQSVSGKNPNILREGDTLETIVATLSRARAALRNLKEKTKTPMIPSKGDALNKEIKETEEEIVALEEALTKIKIREGIIQKAA